ncbi:MAG: hypothetical protein HY964_10280 [Ignavibacteriales bacterium]|nr:hypothetical protein [Ignavibacteriales bacterium]
MGNKLNEAFERADKIPFNIMEDKYVVMSDQHIGDGDKGSDDFRLNVGAYKTALNDYFDKGYKFISIGDSEELWECDFPAIYDKYKDVYSIEAKFKVAGRLMRLHGNHDIFWRNISFIKKYLPTVLNGIKIYESLMLDATEGSIFLTHGHQGEFFSDKCWRIGRFFVRNMWRPLQNMFGFKSTGAAKNIEQRNKREQEYYNWAKEKKLLFIAGHTHRAMFGSISKLDRLRSDVERSKIGRAQLIQGSKEYEGKSNEIKEMMNKLEESRAKEFGDVSEIKFEMHGESSPCYFNDGCCCYDNGITAIEIEGGRIRLVKWPRDNSPKMVYEEACLSDVLERIKS